MASAPCPTCGRPHRRSLSAGAVAALLLVQAVLVLGGVLYMLTVFGDELDSTLDEQVTTVQSDIEGDLDGVRRSVIRQLRAELDARLGTAP
ncbi:MAG: hypothetical protein ACJ762_15175 [Solirubrobacteraceae bacterium]